MRSIISVCVVSILLCAGCQPAVEEPGFAVRIQDLLDAAVAENQFIFGVAVHLESPLAGVWWEGGAGAADPATGAVMTADLPVRIASNTKTFVAAAVLRLAEQGRLDLDDSLAGSLSPEYTAMLAGDGYDVDAITIRHLLTHTSGLFEHAGVPAYTESILADPTHPWTRTEQLSWAVDLGEPHADPGEVYTYCDTGYILLGDVIEHATGRPMAEAVRDLIGYSSLGMDSTWWEILEQPPIGTAERAHQFFGEHDVSAFEPYFDLYGGGGLVATVGDLARFWRGLFGGEIFDDSATLDTMLTTSEGLRPLPGASARALPPGAYRMGLWEVEVGGHRAYRHTGFWGTSATYVPDLDLVVALTVNQNQSGSVMDDLAREVIALVSASTGPSS